MSKYKITFKLKQHTPLIHFQSNQAGATLRATELKPKFDKFLKKYAFGGKIPKEYKISDDKEALDYKVKIYSNKTNNNLVYKTYIARKDRNKHYLKVGSYFGDLKAIEIDNIIVEFFSFKTDLIKLTKDYFIDFIAITNFGSRQNKGFGSFSVIKKDKKEIKFDENMLLKYFPTIYKANSNEPLKKIMQDYQFLKSGTSNPVYKKSLLFQYMCKDKIKWEKRMIKEYMEKDFEDIFKELKYEHKPLKCDDENQKYTYKYIRGLLGIAEHIEFLKTNSKNHKDKINIEIKALDKDLQRFKSPITYKVIENNIYLLVTNDISVKGQKFSFKIKGEKKDLNEPIEIPKNFDIFKFLEFANKQLRYQQLKATS